MGIAAHSRSCITLDARASYEYHFPLFSKPVIRIRCIHSAFPTQPFCAESYSTAFWLFMTLYVHNSMYMQSAVDVG